MEATLPAVRLPAMRQGFPAMTLHPRHFIVSKAQAQYCEFVTKIIKEHHLTYGELVFILSKELSTWAAYQIRDERAIDDPNEFPSTPFPVP